MHLVEAVSLNEWVGIVAAIIGIALAVGAVAVFFRASYSQARIEALRKDNQDMDDRVRRLMDGRMEDQARITTLEAKVTHLGNENGLLRELVTQRAQVDELGIILNDHHHESMLAWRTIRSELEFLKEVVVPDVGARRPS